MRYITADGILLESMLVAPLSDGEQALLENQSEGISLLGPQEDDDQAQSQTKREKRINLDVGPTNKHKKNDVKDR